MTSIHPHRIVVVGGGAGGLELATRLGRKYGRGSRVHVTLVDKNRTHIWKPKLHEIAIHGTLKTTLFTLARMITKQTNPTVKLH